MSNKSEPRYFGRNGLGRFLGVSDTRIGQINPPADAWVDGRPVWSEETAARMKRDREKRRARRADRTASAATA
jgi:hypothetical protein